MLCEFPNLIDWIDAYGIADLHKDHNHGNDSVPFSQFVDRRYHEDKSVWKTMMHRSNPINIEMNDEGEIDIESAKLVLRRIIEKGYAAGLINRIIETEDLAPDYLAALHIVEAFWDVIIPKIEKALKD